MNDQQGTGGDPPSPYAWDNASTGDHLDPRDIETRPIEDLVVMRRLVQADTLVREGLGEARETTLRVPLLCRPDIELSVELPLPPEPLEPLMVIRFGEAVSPDPVREDFFRSVRHLLSTALPGPVSLKMQPDCAEIRWSPRPLTLEVEAQPRFLALARHLLGVMEPEPSPLDLANVVRRFGEIISWCQEGSSILSRTFREHGVLRLPSVGLIHLLTYRTVALREDQPLILCYLTDVDLWSSAPGNGFHLAIRFPGQPVDEWPAPLVPRLIHAIERRFGVPLEQSMEFERLGDWQPVDETCLLVGKECADRTLSSYLLSVKGLLRFATTFVDLLNQGADPLELLGTHLSSTASMRHLEAPAAERRGDATDDASPSASRQPEWKQTLDRLDRKVRAKEPAVPDVDAPLPAPSPAPSSAPSITSRPEALMSTSLSAREVVKKLGADEPEDMDVFLTHPGYNVPKTVDIMSVVLTMPKDEALRVCERSPCLIVGPVARSKAYTLKTILEGTGARIRVVPTGSEAS